MSDSRANVKRSRTHAPTFDLGLVLGHIVVGAAIAGIILTICAMLWVVTPL